LSDAPGYGNTCGVSGHARDKHDPHSGGAFRRVATLTTSRIAASPRGVTTNSIVHPGPAFDDRQWQAHHRLMKWQGHHATLARRHQAGLFRLKMVLRDGGGGGFYARPVASIVIGPDGVKIQPIADATKIAIVVMSAWAGVAVMAMRIARASRRRKL
jgi:hypothetical protein